MSSAQGQTPLIIPQGSFVTYLTPKDMANKETLAKVRREIDEHRQNPNKKGLFVVHVLNSNSPDTPVNTPHTQ